MRLLLDTHIFLWAVNDDKRLKKEVRKLILEAETVYVSSVSIWEVVIKKQIGKIDVNIEELVEAISKSGFSELPITIHHTVALSTLSHLHRDPFDRMLVAQAITEPLLLITADEKLKEYSALVKLFN